MNWIYSTGKKKTSIARVFIKKTIKNYIEINKINFKEKVKKFIDYKIILIPLYLTKNINKFYIKIYVKGGGMKSQIIAIKLGISRALLIYDENLRIILSKNNLLKRDSRIVERKKLGLKKSRKKPQFSKR